MSFMTGQPASGATVNIRRDVKDPYYRYKMPVLMAKIEGKGNGIKTVIPNMADIARSLNRPPSYPTKFFGCELGAQVITDDKTSRYIVNGAHDANRLQDLLDIFITKFVLCPACKNPETDLVIRGRDEIIYTSCKACGVKKPIDQRHKLVTFIIKNVPPAAANGKKKRDDGKKDANAPDAMEATDGGDLENLKNSAGTENVNEDDWCQDMSEQAVEQRRLEQLNQFASKLVIVGGEEEDDPEKDDENAEDEQDPLELLAEFVEAGDAIPSDKALLAKISELKLRSEKAVTVLVQLLLEGAQDAKGITTKLRGHAELWQALCQSEKAQRGMLGGLERFFGLSSHVSKKSLPLVLQYLYQDDLVDEEVLLAWHGRVSKRYVEKSIAKEVREAADPFITWLKNAEDATSSGEEDDCDEEEEEEEEADNDDDACKANHAGKNMAHDGLAPSCTVDGSKEEDLDIDAI